MKKYMFYCLLVLGLLPGMSNVFAAPSDLASLASREERITENSRNVRNGTVYVGSGGMIPSTNISPWAQVSTNVVDPQIVLDLLANKLLTFQVAHPSNDSVYVAFMLYDKDYRMLFSGQHWFRLVQRPDGSWTTPVGAGDVDVNEIYGSQYVKVGKDVNYSVLQKTDKWGNVIDTIELFIDEDGVLIYPSEYMGPVGNVLLYLDNGDVVAYDLKNQGKQIVPTVAGLHVSGSMSNLVVEVAETVGTFVLNPESWNGYGTAKVMKVNTTSGRTINFYGTTTEGESAVQVLVTDMNTGIKWTVDALSDGRIPVYFPRGNYYLYFKWEDGFGNKTDTGAEG